MERCARPKADAVEDAAEGEAFCWACLGRRCYGSSLFRVRTPPVCGAPAGAPGLYPEQVYCVPGMFSDEFMSDVMSEVN